jgi:Domain of unknown function (DU1801)
VTGCLAGASSSEPKTYRCQDDAREIVGSSLLVTGGNPAEVLQPIDEPLDAIALLARFLVKRGPPLAGWAGNDSSDAPLAQGVSDALAAVALVSRNTLGPHMWPPASRSRHLPALHQVSEDSLLVPLASGEKEDNGFTSARGAHMNYGIVCVADTLKHAVRLTFPKGAQLEDPKKVFNTLLDSKTVRAIDFHEGDMLDEAALRALILEAVGLNTSKGRER